MSGRHLAATLALSVVLVATTLPGALADDQGEQQINATVRTSPLGIEFAPPDRPVRAGQPVLLRARISNLGTEAVKEVEATLHTPGSVDPISPRTVTTGSLEPGAHTNVRWRVCAPRTDRPQELVLHARAEARIDDDRVTATTPARLVQVRPHPGRGVGPRCQQGPGAPALGAVAAPSAAPGGVALTHLLEVFERLRTR